MSVTDSTELHCVTLTPINRVSLLPRTFDLIPWGKESRTHHLVSSITEIVIEHGYQDDIFKYLQMQIFSLEKQEPEKSDQKNKVFA